MLKNNYQNGWKWKFWQKQYVESLEHKYNHDDQGSAYPATFL